MHGNVLSYGIVDLYDERTEAGRNAVGLDVTDGLQKGERVSVDVNGRWVCEIGGGGGAVVI